MKRAGRVASPWEKGAFLGAACLMAGVAAAQEGAPPATVVAARVTCSSKPGERQQCPADTSRGVILARSFGESPCLLGKSWGYDDQGVWVARK